MSIYDPDKEIVQKIRDAYRGKLPITVNLEEFNLINNEYTAIMLKIASQNAVDTSDLSSTTVPTQNGKVKAVKIE